MGDEGYLFKKVFSFSITSFLFLLDISNVSPVFKDNV